MGSNDYSCLFWNFVSVLIHYKYGVKKLIKTLTLLNLTTLLSMSGIKVKSCERCHVDNIDVLQCCWISTLWPANFSLKVILEVFFNMVLGVNNVKKLISLNDNNKSQLFEENSFAIIGRVTIKIILKIINNAFYESGKHFWERI